MEEYKLAKTYGISVYSALTIIDSMNNDNLKKCILTLEDCIVSIEYGRLTNILKTYEKQDKSKYYYALNIMSPSTWNNDEGEDILTRNSYNSVYIAFQDYLDILKTMNTKGDLSEHSFRIHKKSRKTDKIISEEEVYTALDDFESSSDEWNEENFNENSSDEW